MKKIVFFSAIDIWSMGKKKGAQSLWLTLKGYADSGYKVIFVTSNKLEQPVEENYHENIEVIRFENKIWKGLWKIPKVSFFVKLLWWIMFMVRGLGVALRKVGKEGVVLTYGYEIYGAPLAKVVGLLWGTPVITRFQGTILIPYVGKRFSSIRFWQHYLAMKHKSDLVIMTNDGTQGDQVLQQLHVPEKRVRFWMNGVNKSLGATVAQMDQLKTRQELGFNAEEQLLLTVSRLETWKRVDRAIRAMVEITRQFPETRLLVAGDGTAREGWEKLAKELHVEDKVRFLGAVSHEDLYKYYAIADIFLSLYDLSNVGNPLLEAMICGKPIITLNNGDTGKLIKNMENGIILPVEKDTEVGSYVVKLLEDRTLCSELGAQAERWAMENFWTWEERIAHEIKEVTGIIASH